ncbi:MAG: pyridoxal phosphate-dependent aminotransferase [Thermogemmatispora sp.]|uniref:pyridoxal phosphate-dependent aminotransferase n=1 Tax=Thermogemmatispora sp. TaxID=1968838 RepID=UPI00261481EB|nr:pyridoxal phosphate-dependent aminotransferase [Thermogemmatispora sp.]MBX5455262.1 pyridoxal phosphate-dependent aminotransferase [Thermogemmatispora sp.]
MQLGISEGREEPGQRLWQRLPPNPLAELRQVAEEQERAGQALLRLEIGEPSFRTPPHIIAAALASLQEEAQTYGPSCGWPWLRELLAEKIRRVNGYEVSPANIGVTVGGTGAVQLALLATVGEGDEVLLPNPGWPHYYRQLAIAGARPVPYPLDPASGWLPDLSELERRVSARTRLLIVNSPGNPTGAVFPREVVAALLDFARRHRLLLLSDECYDELVFEGEHVSPATLLTPAEREQGIFIGVYSFSKTYAMTGWRIGYLVASQTLMRSLSQVLDASYTSLPLATQRAAAAALSGPQDCVAQMRSAYRQRRDRAVALLKRYGRYEYMPHGAFYILVNIASKRNGRQHSNGSDSAQSSAFALELLRRRNVLVVPGSLFGSRTVDHVRVSLGAEEEAIEQGLSTICELCEEEKHAPGVGEAREHSEELGQH